MYRCQGDVLGSNATGDSDYDDGDSDEDKTEDVDVHFFPSLFSFCYLAFATLLTAQTGWRE